MALPHHLLSAAKMYSAETFVRLQRFKWNINSSLTQRYGNFRKLDHV